MFEHVIKYKDKFLIERFGISGNFYLDIENTYWWYGIEFNQYITKFDTIDDAEKAWKEYKENFKIVKWL